MTAVCIGLITLAISTILKLKRLYISNENGRIQKIKFNDTLVFGVIVVVLMGDTGHVMWEQNSKIDNDISGRNMYRKSKTVITIQDNKHIQDGNYEARF